MKLNEHGHEILNTMQLKNTCDDSEMTLINTQKQLKNKKKTACLWPEQLRFQ